MAYFTLLVRFLLLSCLLYLHCSQPLQVAGGGSGTELGGCVVTGTIIDSTTNNPSSGVLVRLRPFDYDAKKPATDTAKVQDNVTNSEGVYAFKGVPSGDYTIECSFNDTLGVTLSCSIDSSDSLEQLPAATVQPMATVIGVQMNDGSDLYTVQVVGLEREVTVDERGSFIVTVPAGLRHIYVASPGSSEPVMDTVITCGAGALLYLEGPAVMVAECNNLECDTLVTRELLTTNGLSEYPPDAYAVIANNRVAELHLRGCNLTTIPASIGRLTHLEVLDIGANSIASLPQDIKNCKLLHTLKADSNTLATVTIGLGLLDSLQQLDLSSNTLQSLPESIVTLQKLLMLNVSNNMLCTSSPAVSAWLEKFSSGWADSQVCK